MARRVKWRLTRRIVAVVSAPVVGRPSFTALAQCLVIRHMRALRRCTAAMFRRRSAAAQMVDNRQAGPRGRQDLPQRAAPRHRRLPLQRVLVHLDRHRRPRGQRERARRLRAPRRRWAHLESPARMAPRERRPGLRDPARRTTPRPQRPPPRPLYRRQRHPFRRILPLEHPLRQTVHPRQRVTPRVEMPARRRLLDRPWESLPWERSSRRARRAVCHPPSS